MPTGTIPRPPDQNFLDSYGKPPPTIATSPFNGSLGRQSTLSPNVAASLQTASHDMRMYIGINPEIWKSYVAVPTNQGQRAAVAQRGSMMFDPRNSPSRSQFSEGYTIPIQNFSAYNTWNTPSGQTSVGKRLSQPSTKAVSPFASAPIPTRMPWDV